MRMLLPNAIREARATHCWTQIELAHKVEVSQGTISFWEHGVESPKLEHLLKLVMALPELFDHLAKRENELLARVTAVERMPTMPGSHDVSRRQ